MGLREMIVWSAGYLSRSSPHVTVRIGVLCLHGSWVMGGIDYHTVTCYILHITGYCRQLYSKSEAK